MTTPDVSVVLLTKNGMQTLPTVISALGRQQTRLSVEVVAVDSGSTDGTVEFLRSRVDRVLTIPQASFNHGTTRNLAIAESRGDLVVLLVQDAVPIDASWLDRLTAPLMQDPAVAGAFCRQQPHVGAGAITRAYLDRWFAARTTARRVSMSREALRALPPLERLDRCTFDNVCACIRRTVWLTHPFSPTVIAEDLEWSRQVLEAGHTVAYVPDAAVEHSHDRSAWYEFARTVLLHRRLFELFGVRTIPTLSALLTSVLSTAKWHWQLTRTATPPESARACLRGLALAFAWPCGQYLGGLSAAKRWRQLRFRGV